MAALRLCVFAVLLVTAGATDSQLAHFEEVVSEPNHFNRKLAQFSFSEVWSDFQGEAAEGVPQDRAECAAGSYITTIRLSLNRYTANGADTIAVGSMQGICDNGVVLAKFPPEAKNDIYFLVKQDGFTEFVGAASGVMQSFMFVGNNQPQGQFSLACPNGLRLSGYQVRASTVVHAVKIKCSKV